MQKMEYAYVKGWSDKRNSAFKKWRFQNGKDRMRTSKEKEEAITKNEKKTSYGQRWFKGV